MPKENIIEILREISEECGKKKQYCWIDKGSIVKALKLNNIEINEKNIDQGDETYKTVISFEGRLFVYVGDKIN